MEMLLWIAGLLIVGFLGFAALIGWAAVHRPEGGKSLNDHFNELSTLPCDRKVTNGIIAALNVIPAYLNSYPEIDEEDESFLRHIDEYYGVIRIRTREMCREDMEPEFSISTPHHGLSDVEEGTVFGSLESEIEHYRIGAKSIADALVQAGLEPIANVSINEEDYSL